MFENFGKLRSTLSLLVFLRRISRELHRANVIAERANTLAETRLMLEYPAWHRSSSNQGTSTIQPRAVRISDLSAPTVEDWNKQYADKHTGENDDDIEEEYNIT